MQALVVEKNTSEYFDSAQAPDYQGVVEEEKKLKGVHVNVEEAVWERAKQVFDDEDMVYGGAMNRLLLWFLSLPPEERLAILRTRRKLAPAIDAMASTPRRQPSGRASTSKLPAEPERSPEKRR